MGVAIGTTYVLEVLCEVCTNKSVLCGRFEVTKLLLRLWARPDCRESIVHECGKKKFQVHACDMHVLIQHFTCMHVLHGTMCL